MRRIVATAVLFVFSLATLGASAYAQSELPTPLQQLQEALASVPDYAPGHVALMVRDLKTGFTRGVNANAVMPAASTIKIPIMVEVFKQMEAGRFDLNRLVHLQASDRDWGSGDLCDAPTGTGIPVSELLTKMITISDNTAANMLIRLVGRQNINAEMADLGLEHTKLADYIRTSEWSVRTTLRTTPADMVNLLTDMAKHELIDQWSSNEMISILEQDQINTLLPVPLPEDIPIAHKTGSFDDTLNDVGIVYGAEPYVIAVMTTDLPSLSIGRTFIHRISRIAYTRFQQFREWRVDNGQQTADLSSSDSTQDLNDTSDTSDDSVQADVPMWATPAPVATP